MASKFAVIFDMDGVLVDNTDYHVRAWKKFLEERGVNLSYKEARDFQGNKNVEILRRYLGKNLSPVAAAKLGAKKERLYRKLYRKEIKSLPELKLLLKELKDNKIKIALATAAPRENVTFVLSLTRLKKYFKIIVDASHVRKGKPDPEIYKLAAKRLKISPKIV